MLALNIWIHVFHHTVTVKIVNRSLSTQISQEDIFCSKAWEFINQSSLGGKVSVFLAEVSVGINVRKVFMLT